MSHVRKQIRAAFVTALTGLTTTGSKVYANRVYSLDDSMLPCWIVSTPFDEILTDDESRLAGLQQHDLTVECVGKCKAGSSVDDTLDTMATEAETAIFAAFPSATVKTIDLASSEVDIEDGSELLVGSIKLTFMVRYLSQDGAPETSL